MGYVSQEPTLFEGTVLENVRIGNPKASEGDVREALIRAGAL